MIGKALEGTKLASVYEVKDILEGKKKSAGELGYEQKLAYEHMEKFAKLSDSEARKLKKELEDLGLKERTSLKVIEVMPTEVNTIKLILVPEKKTFSDDEVKKMLGAVDTYRGK